MAADEYQQDCRIQQNHLQHKGNQTSNFRSIGVFWVFREQTKRGTDCRLTVVHSIAWEKEYVKKIIKKGILLYLE